MSDVHYFYVSEGLDKESLTVILDGEPTPVPTSHPYFARIKNEVRSGSIDEAEIRSLLNDKEAYPNSKLMRLSDRVAIVDGQLTFDGDVVDTALSRHVVRLAGETESDFKPWVAFMEKLSTNPSKLSRIHLYRWLNTANFTLTEDGDILGYKGVRNDDENTSITAGKEDVLVDGEVHVGHIPNPVGAVVEIDRDLVDPDRGTACSTGLHVGVWDYAKSFAQERSGKTLKVAVNPRDVVSVPSDSNDQKMRVCRYTVLEASEAPVQSPVWSYYPTYYSDLNYADQDDDDLDIEEWEREGFASQEDYEDWQDGTGEYSDEKEPEKEPEEEVVQTTKKKNKIWGWLTRG